jgi:hypothetical protein
MQWSDIDFRPSPRKLRQFAAIALVVLAVAGALRGSVVLIAIGVALGALGMIWPAAIRPLYVALTVITFPIGWVVSRVLLAVVFFGVFTPVSLLFRLIRRDALQRRRAYGGSYWVDKNQPADPARYLRQF